MTKPKPPASATHSAKDSQIGIFRKAARELGCDESEERFQEALRTVAKQKPKASKSDRKPAKPAKAI